MAGYSFACNKLGMNCGFELRGASAKEEVLQEATSHLRYAHQMPNPSPDVQAKIGQATTSM